MKRLILSLLFSPLFAVAAPVSFNFTDVPLVAFSQSIFKNLLHVNYVISPDVLANDRKMTLSVSGIEPDKVLPFVEGILQQQGVALNVRDGVYYLVPAGRSLPSPLATDGAAVAAAPVAVVQSAPKAIAFPQDELTPAPRKVDDESRVYVPQNRPAEFLAGVVASSFGKAAVNAAGGNVVLTGSPAALDKMQTLIAAVDVLPKLVDVSASWVEVTNNVGSGRGISLLATVLGAKLGVSLGSVNSGSAISLKSASFQLVVDALNTDSRFKQVSNSRIVGDDYENLVLTVGDETPTISSTGKDNAGNTVQNVVYRPSGVIVDVLPKVLGSGRIQLLVDGQISSFKTTATGVAGSPTLIKRQVKTRVTVANGEVLLIGGLNDTQKTVSTSSLPFLPASWSSKSDSAVQTDLVLILSAKVAGSE
jgi:general secretion pathway protein D